MNVEAEVCGPEEVDDEVKRESVSEADSGTEGDGQGCVDDAEGGVRRGARCRRVTQWYGDPVPSDLLDDELMFFCAFRSFVF